MLLLLLLLFLSGRFDGKLGRDRVYLKAVCDLPPSTEVFVSYGNDYWKSSKLKPTSPQKQPGTPPQPEPEQHVVVVGAPGTRRSSRRRAAAQALCDDKGTQPSPHDRPHKRSRRLCRRQQLDQDQDQDHAHAAGQDGQQQQQRDAHKLQQHALQQVTAEHTAMATGIQPAMLQSQEQQQPWAQVDIQYQAEAVTALTAAATASQLTDWTTFDMAADDPAFLAATTLPPSHIAPLLPDPCVCEQLLQLNQQLPGFEQTQQSQQQQPEGLKLQADVQQLHNAVAALPGMVFSEQQQQRPQQAPAAHPMELLQANLQQQQQRHQQAVGTRRHAAKQAAGQQRVLGYAAKAASRQPPFGADAAPAVDVASDSNESQESCVPDVDAVLQPLQHVAAAGPAPASKGQASRRSSTCRSRVGAGAGAGSAPKTAAVARGVAAAAGSGSRHTSNQRQKELAVGRTRRSTAQAVPENPYRKFYSRCRPAVV